MIEKKAKKKNPKPKYNFPYLFKLNLNLNMCPKDRRRRSVYTVLLTKRKHLVNSYKVTVLNDVLYLTYAYDYVFRELIKFYECDKRLHFITRKQRKANPNYFYPQYFRLTQHCFFFQGHELKVEERKTNAKLCMICNIMCQSQC